MFRFYQYLVVSSPPKDNYRLDKIHPGETLFPVAAGDRSSGCTFLTALLKPSVVLILPVFAPGISGWWPCWHDSRPILPVLIVLLAIIIASYHPSRRYRSPADPFLFCLSISIL